MQGTDWASKDWTYGKILRNKRIIVTGCASGIGYDTAKLIKHMGGDVIGVDRTKTEDYVDELYLADLSDRRTIQALVQALPGQIDGIANIAGVPPTAPADAVLKVNLVGLKYFTNLMIPKLNDNASIVNLASLAGLGWANSLAAINASDRLEFEDVDRFLHEHKISNENGRSYFFSKEALLVWTMKNRWTWRDRGIRMNAVSPGPVETPILKDFMETLGERATEDTTINDRAGRPEDIAPVVCFMLSDMTHWFRGTNLMLDGGMSGHILQNKFQF
ncbi:coniferyl-alcohol dehydrogenase [Alphaproteobacteria bacterium]|nr:coniferyl-alcohol dehydrogenase [Alphaproteobacteria bacterium]MDB3891866.1 coniferyl-alcohol dehydrogenase [Alphaproteobacteria bacterium]